MSPSTAKLIMTLVAGIAGTIAGALTAQEPHTLALTLWAVGLGALSSGLLAAAHVPQPGTAALKEAARDSVRP